MTTTLAFALRPALPTDVDFEHFLYASTRDDLRPLGPEVFDGLVGMRLSEGFTRLWPSVIVATCFVVGAGFLAKAVNRGGLSTTYVIGLGLEALISVGIGLALLGERLTVAQTAGIAIILVGLATLKHG